MVSLDKRRQRLVHLLSPRHDHGIGPLEIPYRLPQAAGREKSIAEGLPRGVDQHEIEPARDLPVLEPVIKEHAIDFGMLGEK